jgi:hypothetical protein
MAIVMRIVVKSIPYFPSHLVQPSHKSGLILLKLDRYNKISKVQKIKETRYLLTKWKLCDEKNHFGTAKPRKLTIQRQSKLQSTRTHKT